MVVKLRVALSLGGGGYVAYHDFGLSVSTWGRSCSVRQLTADDGGRLFFVQFAGERSRPSPADRSRALRHTLATSRDVFLSAVCCRWELWGRTGRAPPFPVQGFGVKSVHAPWHGLGVVGADDWSQPLGDRK